MKKLKTEDINFDPKAIKLKAGKGNWYTLTQNGRVVLEGGPGFMHEKLEQITDYTDAEIQNKMDESLTDFIVIAADLTKLQNVIESILDNLSLKNLTIKILEDKKK
jgi:hypothetical protein